MNGRAQYGRLIGTTAGCVATHATVNGPPLCGTELVSWRRLDSMEVGPADLVGRQVAAGTLCVGPDEVWRFVSCRRCQRSITSGR